MGSENDAEAAIRAQCSADRGVEKAADGRAVALRCGEAAAYRVTYAGVVRNLCEGHRATFCRSRPDAEVARLTGGGISRLAKALGFEGESDLATLICAVDLSAPGALGEFEAWKLEDGSRAGLAEIAKRFPRKDQGGRQWQNP